MLMRRSVIRQVCRTVGAAQQGRRLVSKDQSLRFIGRNGLVAMGEVVPSNTARWFASKPPKDDDDEEDLLREEKKVFKTDEKIQEFLAEAVKNHPILLFMKGTPAAPRCGFSMTVSKILDLEGVDFSSADVLSSDEIREGIKQFSDWPTIPQLYVNGEFIGGCDIVKDMHASGELATLLAPIKKQQEEERKQQKQE